MILWCKECEARVDAAVLQNYEEYDPEKGPPSKYSFLKCHTCASPFLTLQNNYGHGWDDPFLLYPAQPSRINPSFPEAIQSAYGEAVACFRGKAFTAAAIMCRKTLEGVCAEHGVNGRSLTVTLKGLRDKGVIEGRLYEWADALRITGNEAAHDVTVNVSQEDAQDIMEFTNALLEYVFSFRDRFEEFRKRRLARLPPDLS
jgi:hypothetical protein